MSWNFVKRVLQTPVTSIMVTRTGIIDFGAIFAGRAQDKDGRLRTGKGEGKEDGKVCCVLIAVLTPLRYESRCYIRLSRAPCCVGDVVDVGRLETKT